MDEDAHVEHANKRLGTVLSNKYTVERILGVGGMAVVYAATHRNQKQVAIKMLHRPWVMESEGELAAQVAKRLLEKAEHEGTNLPR